MKTHPGFTGIVKASLRFYLKHSGISLTNLISLVIGMVSFMLLISYARYELGYDKFFTKADRIYLLGQTLYDLQSGSSESTATTSGIVAPTLKNEFQEVEYAVRTKEVQTPLIFEENRFVEDGLYADKDFFKLFDFDLLAGDPESALGAPKTIVLTASLAKKLFGQENPIGKTLLGEKDIIYTVTGIIEDVPSNTHLKFDYLISFLTMYSLRNDIDNSWSILNYKSYICLKDKTLSESFEDKLSLIIEKYHNQYCSNRSYFLIPLREIHLTRGVIIQNVDTTEKFNIYMIVFVAFLILSIACINYVNLATARSTSRIREVGIRKVHGATRSSLVGQFMLETYVLSFISLIFSLLIVVTILPLFNNVAGLNIPVSYLFDWKSIGSFIILFVLTGLFAGAYPSLFVLSKLPMSTSKQPNMFRQGKTQWRFRNILTIIQFGVSVVLVLFGITIHSQLNFIRGKDTGYNRENIMAIRIWNNETRNNITTIKNELLTNPRLLSVAVSNVLPLVMTERNDISLRNDKDEKVEIPMVTTYFIDEDYLDLFNMKVLEGRNFSLDLASNIRNQVIVNESLVDQSGLVNPIGKKILKWGQELEIIGVVKDFHFSSFKNRIEPILLAYNPSLSKNILIRISESDQESTIMFIESVLRKFNTNLVYDYSFIDDQYNELYKKESHLGKLVIGFSLLTLLLSIMGMMSLISFVVKRQFKEIGIKKALGASSSDIFRGIFKRFIIPIAIAVVIFLPVAIYFSNQWLQDFHYRINVSIAMIIGSLAINAGFAFLAIFGQTMRAANTNPVTSLQTE